MHSNGWRNTTWGFVFAALFWAFVYYWIDTGFRDLEPSIGAGIWALVLLPFWVLGVIVTLGILLYLRKLPGRRW